MLGKWTVFAVKEPDDRWMDRKKLDFLKKDGLGVGGNELLEMDAPKLALLIHFSLLGCNNL